MTFQTEQGKGGVAALWGRMLSSPKPLPLCLILLATVGLLYGSFLRNPLVFDDEVFFGSVETLRHFGSGLFQFSTRWISYATFGWLYSLFGFNISWMRLGNLLLHAGNAIALFVFLRVLFSAIFADHERAHAPFHALSETWCAFFAALIFALHPVAVYGAAYLMQCSILMATLFSLLTLLAYMQGLVRSRPVFFVVAAACYFLAVFSKEHSVMVPGVALALTFLLRRPSLALLRQIWLPFVLFAIIGATITLKVKGILGSSYEPQAQEMFLQLAKSHGAANIAVTHPAEAPDPYLLSVLTQSFLFFKYLALWILPNPGWMSIDMRELPAADYMAWPHTLGLIGFVMYGVLGTRLLFLRGSKGLAGFAMLFPWILFMTELSSIRAQETFVLYRSYLWMVGMFAALPLLLGKLGARPTFVLLLAISAFLFPLSWNRLTTFSSPVLLWGDAEKLVRNKTYLPGAGRIYYNLGTSYGEMGLRREAIDNLSRAIEISPRLVLAYGNRAAAYFEEGRFSEALLDFEKTIAMDPKNQRAYLGRGLCYEALGMRNSALPDFAKSCELGLEWACNKHKELYQNLHGASDGRTSRQN